MEIRRFGDWRLEVGGEVGRWGGRLVIGDWEVEEVRDKHERLKFG
jgi:hypothetical protein